MDFKQGDKIVYISKSHHWHKFGEVYTFQAFFDGLKSHFFTYESAILLRIEHVIPLDNLSELEKIIYGL